jgi:dCTP deaminase
MSILSGWAIKQAVACGDIKIDPYDPLRVRPNSYDVELGDELYSYVPRTHMFQLEATALAAVWGRLGHFYGPIAFMDCYAQQTLMKVPKIKFQDAKEARTGWLLTPGVLYLGSTKECTAGNRYVPSIDGRSSIGRLGIRIHATAGRGDVGFEGRWTLEIDVVQPVWLEPGVRVAQISWQTVEGHIEELYNTTGKYVDSASGVIPSRLFKEKKG